jgi:hypothetical protein
LPKSKNNCNVTWLLSGKIFSPPLEPGPVPGVVAKRPPHTAAMTAAMFLASRRSIGLMGQVFTSRPPRSAAMFGIKREEKVGFLMLKISAEEM